MTGQFASHLGGTRIAQAAQADLLLGEGQFQAGTRSLPRQTSSPPVKSCTQHTPSCGLINLICVAHHTLELAEATSISWQVSRWTLASRCSLGLSYLMHFCALWFSVRCCLDSDWVVPTQKLPGMICAVVYVVMIIHS